MLSLWSHPAALGIDHTTLHKTCDTNSQLVRAVLWHHAYMSSSVTCMTTRKRGLSIIHEISEKVFTLAWGLFGWLRRSACTPANVHGN